jgi:hypothetical protein
VVNSTRPAANQIWDDIKINQQRILADKRIKHRNFGEYSKHLCGEEKCLLNGIMVKQGSWLAEESLHFIGDKNKYQQKIKSEKRKSDRKKEKHIIQTDAEND